ncbi:MAG: tetratricopeptide repeat protein [Balneolaceae bacterium]|nr:MAG: tetratricopeptide repeat protein [Balneolaceae bacterium]
MKQLLLLLIGLLLTASVLNDARKANEAFQRGDYEEAVQLYRQAIAQNPDDARLYFNLGNALSKLGSTEEAVEAYENFKSRSENAQEQSLADYNKGRIHTDLEQYDEALNFYRDALRKNPHDEDARHNFELALRKQQEQQEQEPQPDQQSGDDDNENGDDEQEQSPENQEGDQEQDSGQQPDSPEDQDGEQEQLPQPQDMTREEAENLLDALEQLERELLENRKKEATESSSNDKDW